MFDSALWPGPYPSNLSAMTAAVILCQHAGVPIEEVCRRARISRASFEAIAAHGRASSAVTHRLYWALCEAWDPLVFAMGYEMWQKLVELSEKSSTE